MRRFSGVLAMVSAIALAAAIFGTSSAAIAGETATSTTFITPRGPLFKEVYRPVDAHLEVKVSPTPGTTKFRELNNTRLNLPTDLKFSTEGTPACEKDIGQIDPEKANRSTAAVIAECPDSVVGQGTAVINVAGFVDSPITDPVLTVFNGGKDENGDPILLTHGFSADVLPGGFGIILIGSLHEGVLDVKVPPLPVNSAVSAFSFDLPGEIGKDPDYVQSKCTTGTWTANAVLTFGTYDANTGQFENQEDVATDPNHQSCDGEVGKATFPTLKVKGPTALKIGAKGTFRVTLENTGTATAKNVKITAAGAGKGSKGAGTIAIGALKTVKVKAKVTGKKGKKVTLKLKVSGKNVKPRTGKVSIRLK